MTTAAGSLQIVPQSPPSAPALRAADQGVADALESVLSDNTKRLYGAHWRLFTGWCGDVDLRALPAEALTVARYLAVRAGSGASIATMRLATSAITKAHEWAKQESPCRDPGVRASLRDGEDDHRSLSARPAPSPPSSPAVAAAASKRPSRLRSERCSTWPWWRRCPTPD